MAVSTTAVISASWRLMPNDRKIALLSIRTHDMASVQPSLFHCASLFTRNARHRPCHAHQRRRNWSENPITQIRRFESLRTIAISDMDMSGVGLGPYFSVFSGLGGYGSKQCFHASCTKNKIVQYSASQPTHTSQCTKNKIVQCSASQPTHTSQCTKNKIVQCNASQPTHTSQRHSCTHLACLFVIYLFIRECMSPVRYSSGSWNNKLTVIWLLILHTYNLPSIWVGYDLRLQW